MFPKEPKETANIEKEPSPPSLKEKGA